MSISEQVKYLREFDCFGTVKQAMLEAANTIEALSAKLQSANEEERRIKKYLKYGFCPDCGSAVGEGANPCFECGAIIDWDLLKEDEKRSADCGGGWIPCKDRLPKDGVDVLVWFEYFRYGEYSRLFQAKGISYTFDGKWSGFVNGSSGWNQLKIIAWQPMPEDYRP